MLDAMEHCPLPIVGVVQGAAIAGGNELALHCDFVVASTKARFGMSLSQIGLAPTWFLTKKIMETAGPAKGRELLLLGDPLPAETLHEWGMIARVVPEAELEAAVKKITDRLCANAPLSMRAMKAIMVKQMSVYDLPDREPEAAQADQIWDTLDAREGVRARMEKRPPKFNGA